MTISETTSAGPSRSKIRLLVASEPGLAGVKRHVCESLALIDTDRFDVLFCYSLGRADESYAGEIAHLRQRGIECVEIPMVREISPFRDLLSLWRLSRVASRFRPDLIHCHSAKAGYLGRAVAKLRWNRPISVYTPHAMPCFSSKLAHRLERLAGAWTDWIVAVSESEREDIIAWEILASPERIKVLHLGVDQSDLPSRTRVDAGFYIGGCGRICAQKNALLFFRAGASMLEKYQDARLIWVGDYSGDEHSQQVRQFVQESPFQDRIEITGWVNDAHQRIAQLDVFCIFSAYESFGYVTADAMAMGVPVIGTKTTGTRDLVEHGKTGLLVEAEPEDAFRALDRLYGSEALRHELTNAARANISGTYNPHCCQRALEEFYDELVYGNTEATPSKVELKR